MGSSASCCCCRPRRSSRVGADLEMESGQHSNVMGDGKASSSHSLLNLSSLIPGMGKHIDSSSLVYGNHLTLPSTKETLEFVHRSRLPSGPITVDEEAFHFHHLIDTGGFGFVFKATRKTTGATYALKVQPMEFMSKLTRAGGNRRANQISLQMEKTALAACRGHPFIVSLEYSFHTSLYAILAMEYVPGGTLSRLIAHSPRARLPCDLARVYTAEIALALNFMHEKGIIYRDVKPSNILIDLDGHVKITDFGLAGSMLIKKKQVNPQEDSSSNEGQIANTTNANEVGSSSEDDGSDSSSARSMSSEYPEGWTDDENTDTDDIKGDLRRVRRRTLCGTAGYRPPELVGERFVDYANRNGYDERVDFFSLGVTVFTMLCGRRPFPTKKQMMQSQDGVSSPLTKRSEISGDHQSSAVQRAAARKLMKDIEFKCLQQEVKFPDFLQEDSDAKSLVEQLLAKDPDSRPRFDGIKSHPWMSELEFDAEKLKQMKLPVDWVQKHAVSESKPKSLRRNSMAMASHHRAKTDLSLTLFIEDIIAQMTAMRRDEDAQNAAERWMAEPSPKTKELFRHWNYISDEALELEMNAATAQPKFLSRRKMRRATHQ